MKETILSPSQTYESTEDEDQKILEVRDDIGKLWENFIISERIKKQTYQSIYANNYFWRTYDQKELLLIHRRLTEIFVVE